VKIISKQKTARNFYDLGCARGALAVRIKRNFPLLHVYAIDSNPLRIFTAKARALLWQCDVHFLRKDIFKVDLSNVDIVYTYLWYDLMPELELKFRRELKPGALVISNTSELPTWEPIQKIVVDKASWKSDDVTLFIYRQS